MEFNVSADVTLMNLTLMHHINDAQTSMTSVHNAGLIKSSASSAWHEWWHILLSYCIIFVLSISGNSMVIATLTSNRRMRTITNVFLLNLAVSDFLQVVFCLPFTLVGQICRKFLFGAAMCKMIPFLQAVSVTVDVWTLVAISLERYFAICRPLRSRQWQTQCHAYKIIAIVWLLSLMFNSPILLVSQLQPMRNNAYKCREVWPGPNTEKIFNLALDAALFLFPLFIMSFAYSLIVSKLWRGMKHEIQHNFNWQTQLSRRADCKSCCDAHVMPVADPLPDISCKNNGNHLIQSYNTSSKEVEELKLNQELSQNHCIHTPFEIDFRHAVRSTHIDKSIEAKRKVIRMLFVIIINFFLCWTPVHLINTVYLFYPEVLYSYIGPKTIAIFQLLAYCSSCCNPITYCFMNRKFRQGFIHLIRRCKIFGCCFSEESETQRQVTLQPSSQDMTNCVVRGSQTGRTGRRGMCLAAAPTAAQAQPQQAQEPSSPCLPPAHLYGPPHRS